MGWVAAFERPLVFIGGVGLGIPRVKEGIWMGVEKYGVAWHGVACCVSSS